MKLPRRILMVQQKLMTMLHFNNKKPVIGKGTSLCSYTGHAAKMDIFFTWNSLNMGRFLSFAFLRFLADGYCEDYWEKLTRTTHLNLKKRTCRFHDRFFLCLFCMIVMIKTKQNRVKQVTCSMIHSDQEFPDYNNEERDVPSPSLEIYPQLPAIA